MKLALRAVLLSMSLLSALALWGCVQYEIIADMAELEKHYVSAVLETGGDNYEEAVLALKNLKLRWGAFKAKYRDYKKGESSLYDGLEAIGDMISDADRLAEARNLAAAHKGLQKARAAFMRLRRENGIDYFPDYLTDFNLAAGPVFVSVSDGRITPGELERIAGAIPAIKEAWGKAMSAPFKRKLFSFSEAKEKRMKTQMGLEAEAITKLERALNEGDGGQPVLRAAGEMKLGYMKLYRLFGGDDIGE